VSVRPVALLHKDDERWMSAAIRLARRSAILSRPNPCVACLIVRNDQLVARGVTAKGGRPHAEAAALAAAEQAGITDFSDCTFYVTLEPCAHLSDRGPVCTNLLLNAKPDRLVIAMNDPDPRTSGQGIKRLRQAGITGDTGICDEAAQQALAGYIRRVMDNRPHIILKLATSLDGKIALLNGESQWITGEESRAHSHAERAQQDAILVGGGTMRSDHPRLNVRLSGLEGRSPQRAVLTRAAAPPDWLSLDAPLKIGEQTDALSVMIEGGAGAAAAFMQAGLVDELLLYRAPIMLGQGAAALDDIGLSSLHEAHNLWQLVDSRMLGKDRMERYVRIRAIHGDNRE